MAAKRKSKKMELPVPYDPLHPAAHALLPQPCGALILVKEDPPEEKTAGGLVLTATSQDTKVNMYCTVVKLGESGMWNKLKGDYDPVNFEVGERLYCPRVGGQGYENPNDRKGKYWFVNAGNPLARLAPGQ